MSGLPDRITPISQKTFDETNGSSLIACQFMLVLYGIASLQVYIYFLSYGRDTVWIKFLVVGVWLLATLHAAFVSHSIWHYLVRSYTRPLLIVDGEWSVYTGTAAGTLVCLIIQMYFTRTIYLLTKGRLRNLLTIVLGILLLGQLAFAIYFTYNLYHLWELPKLHEAVYTSMVPLFLIRVVSDTIISSTLCITLHDSRGLPRSIKLVKTFIIYSVNRFLLTTIVVVVQTIILIAKPKSIWAMVIDFITAQLYINSFLAMLNSRKHLRQIGEADSQFITASGDIGGARSNVAPVFGRPRANTQRSEIKLGRERSLTGIAVNTETGSLSDYTLGDKPLGV